MPEHNDDFELSQIHKEMAKLTRDNDIPAKVLKQAYRDMLKYEYMPEEINMSMADNLNLIKSNWDKLVFVFTYAPKFITFIYYLLKKKEQFMQNWKSTTVGIGLAVLQAVGALWTTGHLTWQAALTAIITAIFGFVVHDPKKKTDD